jgi:hypothetical protein
VNRTQKRQVKYGGIYGVGAAILVLVIAYWLTPETGLPSWKTAAFVLLDAHAVEIVVDQKPGTPLFYPGDVDYLSPDARRALQVLSVMSASIASVLTSVSMGWTTRQEYILKNSLYPAGAYSVALFAILLLSNARPGFRLTIFVLVGGMLALWIGSTVLQGATGGFPLIGVVSLGGILLVGLLVLAVGWTLVQIMLPIVGIAVGGALLGGGAVYVAREYR